MRRIAAAFAVFALVWPALALAQAVVPVLSPIGATIVTGQPLVNAALQWLAAFTMALIPVVITWLSIMVNRKWGVQIDAGLRDGLQTSALNEAAVLIQRLGPMAATMTRLDVKNPVVADAIQSIINRAPAAIKRWPGLEQYGGAEIAKILEAKLGLLTGVTDANGSPVGAAKPSIPVSAAPGGSR